MVTKKKKILILCYKESVKVFFLLQIDFYMLLFIVYKIAFPK